MNRLLLISISLLFLIVGIGCAAAANDLSANVHANECLGKVHEDPILQCPLENADGGFVPYSRGDNTFNTSQTGNEFNEDLNITQDKINLPNDFGSVMSNNPYDTSGRDIF